MNTLGIYLNWRVIILSDGESEYFDSIGGFVIGILGRFPEEEEIIEHDNIKFIIEKNRKK